jgi:hypothetical protein
MLARLSGEKLRSGSAEAKAALSPQGRYLNRALHDEPPPTDTARG